MIKRRDFLKLLGGAGAGLSAAGWSTLAMADKRKTRSGGAVPVPTDTGIKGRVVVVGGGMAGATVAKYLRLWGGTGVEVTLIERESVYTSNIMSNLVLNGQRSFQSLLYGYGTLTSRYGIQMVHGDVVAIDPVKRTVALADGSRIGYDRLVVAPGIDFDTVPGLETAAAQAKVPHAWKAGPQTTALRNMITAMPQGGTFVMSIPAKPYRCPPGPYERACVVADWLKRNKPGSQVIVLDANPNIIAEPHAFTEGFALHGIHYYPNASVTGVDASAMTVHTTIGSISANVINVIPPHRAGKVVTDNGLADQGGRWTSVDVRSYEAQVAPGIHVIGDASATTQPKAGHIANQEAKVCADAIIRLLSGLAPDPSPVTNSSCYSPITADTASWLTAVFGYDAATGTMKAVPGATAEAAGRSAENYKDMIKWFDTLMSDSFA
jgi:NADPH-dependent 2,4-dienoyl-CoA reductase/sulfur reductase-like enzyme